MKLSETSNQTMSDEEEEYEEDEERESFSIAAVIDNGASCLKVGFNNNEKEPLEIFPIIFALYAKHFPHALSPRGKSTPLNREWNYCFK